MMASGDNPCIESPTGEATSYSREFGTDGDATAEAELEFSQEITTCLRMVVDDDNTGQDGGDGPGSDTFWGRVLDTQPEPGPWLIAVAGLIALNLVMTPRAWRIARNAVTIAHEGGHALAALLTGRRLDGVRLHSDTSGLTVSRGKPHGVGMVLTAAAGYPAPPLLGLGGAWLLAADHITALLCGAVALLLAMLVMVRNVYGVLTTVAAGGTFVLVSWLAGPQVQAAFAYGVVWFLLLGGVRPVFELQRKRRRGAGPRRGAGGGHGDPGVPDSDADQLARLTRVPAALWLVLFHAVALCALVGGTRWLIGG